MFSCCSGNTNKGNSEKPAKKELTRFFNAYCEAMAEIVEKPKKKKVKAFVNTFYQHANCQVKNIFEASDSLPKISITAFLDKMAKTGADSLKISFGQPLDTVYSDFCAKVEFKRQLAIYKNGKDTISDTCLVRFNLLGLGVKKQELKILTEDMYSQKPLETPFRLFSPMQVSNKVIGLIGSINNENNEKTNKNLTQQTLGLFEDNGYVVVEGSDSLVNSLPVKLFLHKAALKPPAEFQFMEATFVEKKLVATGDTCDNSMKTRAVMYHGTKSFKPNGMPVADKVTAVEQKPVDKGADSFFMIYKLKVKQ